MCRQKCNDNSRRSMRVIPVLRHGGTPRSRHSSLTLTGTLPKTDAILTPVTTATTATSLLLPLLLLLSPVARVH